MEQSEAALQPGAASRNWDEDADPTEEGYLPPLACADPYLIWEAGGAAAAAEGGPSKALVVGLAGAGELFVRHCLCGGAGAKRIGVLVLPQSGDIGRAPASAEEAAEAPSAAVIYQTANREFLLVGVQGEVPGEAANLWASTLLSALKHDAAFVLDIQPIHSHFTDELEPPSPPLLLKLETTAHQASALGKNTAARAPAPNHVSGVAAALLTRCELRQVATAVYLSLQDTQDASEETLSAFAAVLSEQPLAALGLTKGVVAAKCVAASKEAERAEGSIATRNRMFL